MGLSQVSLADEVVINCERITNDKQESLVVTKNEAGEYHYSVNGVSGIARPLALGVRKEFFIRRWVAIDSHAYTGATYSDFGSAVHISFDFSECSEL